MNPVEWQEYAADKKSAMSFEYLVRPKNLGYNKSLEGTECPTVDIEIYKRKRREKRDCSETIINWQTLESKNKT